MLDWLTNTEISIGAALFYAAIALLVLAGASEIQRRVVQLRDEAGDEHTPNRKEDTRTKSLGIVDTPGTTNEPKDATETTAHDRAMILNAAKVLAIRAYMGRGLNDDASEVYDEYTEELLKDTPDFDEQGEIAVEASCALLNDIVEQFIETGRQDLHAFLNDWHESAVAAYRMEQEFHPHG